MVMGKEGFIWFFGLVEDVQDPLQIGRARVRCHGFHNVSADVLPKTDLPWAHVIMPITSASYQEKGMSPTFLREGATVFGFFADGAQAQMPVIMGTMPGIPQPDPNFVDSNNISQDNHDVNKLARGINKLAAIKEQVGIDEEFEIPPTSTFGAQYPFNKVFESERGHIIEVDDTPGAERIHIFHNGGHYVEMVSGLRTDKVNGDHIEISMRDRYIKVRGNMAIVVDGASTIASTGAITLSSNTSITMDAPLINISSKLGTSISAGAALVATAGITSVSGMAGLFLNPGG